MKRFFINIISVCSFVVLALTACTDVWDEHYQTNPALAGDENLWELISSNPDLEEFAALLVATGYDSLLTMNRNYTVWAPISMPDGFLLDGASDSLLSVYRKEIVENHIADFSHVAGGIRDKDDIKSYKKIKMLNGKFYDFAKSKRSGGYEFSEKGLKVSNVMAKNGVLHVLNGHADFSANIWEQLAKVQLVDSLRSFLYKDYDDTEFDPYASTPGPIVDGKLTYLDSVYKISCRWFNEIGQLNREDSSYTMYALTNNAWMKMYEMAKTYFVYDTAMVTKSESTYGQLSSEKATEAIAKDMMCRNLVFSNTINKKYFQGESDTLVSNYRYAYPRQVFVGNYADTLRNGMVEEFKLSNGTLYVVDEVNYDPFVCWHDTIRVEGESVGYQSEFEEDVAKATVVSKGIHQDSTLYDRISKGAIGVVTPIAVTGKPILKFYVDNILSGYYKISIVLLPPNIVDPADTIFVKPNKFKARLYVAGKMDKNMEAIEFDGDGKAKKGEYVSNELKIDTIVLAECVKVPFCEYNLNIFKENKRKTHLEIQTSVTAMENKGSSRENWKYDTSYRIDQVIFEPVDGAKGE